MKKIYSLIIGALLCLNVSTVVYAQNKSDNNANIIFNWAEKNYAALFPKTNSIFSSNTDSITSTSGWIYRYYAKTNNYLGVHNGSVYVAGASFPNSTSNPLKVFSIEKALVQVNADVSYADQVTLVGSELPYKVLRNDLGFEIRNGGFGSSAAAHPTKTNQFYALTDRGPNATYTGKNGKGKKFPIANYTPRIGLFQLGADAKISLIKEILLKDNNGQNITGLPNSSALGGTGETPYDVNGNVITDKAGNIKLDDFGLDAEGLAVLKDGTFWVSDEYGPHIVHFDANGKEIGRINAFTNDTRTQLNLPKEYANRRANRGMEGLDRKSVV